MERPWKHSRFTIPVTCFWGIFPPASSNLLRIQFCLWAHDPLPHQCYQPCLQSDDIITSYPFPLLLLFCVPNAFASSPCNPSSTVQPIIFLKHKQLHITCRDKHFLTPHQIKLKFLTVPKAIHAPAPDFFPLIICTHYPTHNVLSSKYPHCYVVLAPCTFTPSGLLHMLSSFPAFVIQWSCI